MLGSWAITPKGHIQCASYAQRIKIRAPTRIGSIGSIDVLASIQQLSAHIGRPDEIISTLDGRMNVISCYISRNIADFICTNDVGRKGRIDKTHRKGKGLLIFKDPIRPQ